MFYADVISFFVTRKCQEIRKIDDNSFDGKDLHIF